MAHQHKQKAALQNEIHCAFSKKRGAPEHCLYDEKDIARAMTLQMRYVFPIIMGFIAYTSGAIAIYFITSNLFGVAQEFFVRRSLEQKAKRKAVVATVA